MEPPSPIQALGVDPFPSRCIIRTVPRGDFARQQWEEPITTTIYIIPRVRVGYLRGCPRKNQ